MEDTDRLQLRLRCLAGSVSSPLDFTSENRSFFKEFLFSFIFGCFVLPKNHCLCLPIYERCDCAAYQLLQVRDTKHVIPIRYLYVGNVLMAFLLKIIHFTGDSVKLVFPKITKITRTLTVFNFLSEIVSLATYFVRIVQLFSIL